MDDGNPSSGLVGVVMVCDLVPVRDSCGYVRSRRRGDPGFGEEDDIRGEGDDEVPDLGGMFAE